MDELSYLGNNDIEVVDGLYKKFKKNPDSVDKSWRHFFEGFEFSQKIYKYEDFQADKIEKEFKVIELINAYRKRGHLFTKTNPVRTRRQYLPTLDLENYHLSQDDLDVEFHAGKEIGIGTAKLRDIEQHLKDTYCQSVGSEFMFIRKPDRIKWLQDRIESTKNTTQYSPEEKKNFYFHLRIAVGFEQFVHKKFVGQKRFSIEGTETIIPALNNIIETGAEKGIEEFIIGMAHRGRLNILGNILQKPYENIFQEFIADEYEEDIALGDVKYHLGYGNDIKTSKGKTVRVNLAPNPSHLEAVLPIIEGISRAKIDHKYNKDYNKLLPIAIHGDAAIAAQGVVYEVAQMVELDGYKTGGTIHIVINNQIGFTTNYLEARSSTYCTDIGKVTKSPIFHVNGDDVEALVHVTTLAIDYRRQFHSDVFIDILSYRKYGHNESDEPRFTQPLLYKIIEKHPSPRDIYSQHLIEQGVFTKDQINQYEEDFNSILEEKLEKSKKIDKVRIKQFLVEDWKGYEFAESNHFEQKINTSFDKEKLIMLAQRINTLPGDLKFFSKIKKLNEGRLKRLKDNVIDWAMAELLAYATLITEKTPVRISGQDSLRGTFAHRHAGFVIDDTDQKYIPLHHIEANQVKFDVYNSPLSEYGVLGFEYGYALATPFGLTVWEAQFGDFVNVAQVIVDQYISSAEEKWGLMNGLVLYLPHGYEGQGPEHSSARMERFLSSCSRNNMHVVNCSTPANFFHLLRRHMHANYKVPLVIFTPKSLLRHPKCISTIEDLAEGHFFDVIDDENVDIENVTRLVFCSGKIYYDLLEKKEELNAREVALVRIEQLHPFPEKRIKEIVKKYPNNLLTLWVQEEPENMGAWRHLRDQFKDIQVVPISRLGSASPATGLSKIHLIQQKEIIGKVFRQCDCEKMNNYCDLQCLLGASREDILKQHQYFEKVNL
jgi:2-oxoglutarate dehydrogenase E1 component